MRKLNVTDRRTDRQTDGQGALQYLPSRAFGAAGDNITTRASREITSQKHIKIFDFNGVNVAKHWHVAGEVFAISDCLVSTVTMHASNVHVYIFSVYLILHAQILTQNFLVHNTSTIYTHTCLK